MKLKYCCKIILFIIIFKISNINKYLIIKFNLIMGASNPTINGHGIKFVESKNTEYFGNI